jgi:hypothetical protein
MPLGQRGVHCVDLVDHGVGGIEPGKTVPNEMPGKENA